jgi:transaldolase
MSIEKRLKIDIYADVSAIDQIKEYADNQLIKGFTTNPTLIKKSGEKSYRDFIFKSLEYVGRKRISFEVISDELEKMLEQALILSKISPLIDVKIPITNTKKEFTLPVIRELLDKGISVNVTAVMTDAQINRLSETFSLEDYVIVSVFAGRIADTGRDPLPLMKNYKDKLSRFKNVKLLWASPREVLNVYQANDVGCDILTATVDILAKLPSYGKDLAEFSLETVEMFYKDACTSKFVI